MARSRKTLAAITTLVVFLMIVASCGGGAAEKAGKTPATAAPTAAATVAPMPAATPNLTPVVETGAREILGVVSQRDIKEAKYGGTLRGFIYASTTSLDPVDLTGPSGDDYTGGLFDRLLEWSPFDPSKSIPDLAESWSVDSTGTVYTFKLRPGVQWHDGTPFTAADVEATFSYWQYTWEKYKKTQRVGGFIVPLLKSYRAVDDMTFEVTLKGTASNFISIVTSAHYNIYPKHKLAPFLKLTKFDPVYTGDERPPVGTGPFKYGKFIPGVSMEWVKNDAYWRKDPEGRKLPYLDATRAVVIEDNTTSFAAFRVGQIDFYTPFPILTAEQGRSLDNTLKDKIVVVRGSALLNEGLTFNQASSPAARERDFRWALNLIIDREEFKDRVFQGEVLSARVLDSRVWPAYVLPESEIAKSPWVKADPGRVAEAKRLLTGIGVTPETYPEIVILARNTGFYCKQAELAALQLKHAGFVTKVECPSASVGSAFALEGKFGLNAQANGTTVPDPIISMQQRYQPVGDFIAWINKDKGAAAAQIKVNKLLEQASGSLDPKEIQAALWEIQRVLYFEDSPNIDLGWSNTIVPVYKYVRGLTTYSGLYEPQIREYTWLNR